MRSFWWFFSTVVLAFLTAFAPGYSAEEKKPKPQTLFINCNIFDGKADKLANNGRVLVEGNLIKTVGDANLKGAEQAEIVDCAGRTLMPGLIDAHTHIMVTGPTDDVFSWQPEYIAVRGATEATAQLMRGFTTIRDMGGPTMSVKRAADEGIIPGPRIYSSEAFIGPTGGSIDFRPDFRVIETGRPTYLERIGVSKLVDGPNEITKAAREVISRGAAQVKVYTSGNMASYRSPIEAVSYTAEELRAAVGAAEDNGTYVVIHSHNPQGAKRGIEAGAKCIEHATNLTKELVEMIIAKDAWVVPNFYGVSISQNPPDFLNPVQKAKLAKIGANGKRSYDLIVAAGDRINVAFGTDQLGGPADQAKQLLEFAARAEFYENVDVLRQATSANGRLLSLSNVRNPYPAGPLGVIEPGAYADILLIDGDPLADIRVLETPEKNLDLIMKDGVIYKNTLN